jgi:hypothetical protein
MSRYVPLRKGTRYMVNEGGKWQVLALELPSFRLEGMVFGARVGETVLRMGQTGTGS